MKPRGIASFVPAHYVFYCGGSTYRWNKPEDLTICTEEATSTNENELPEGWTFHPEHGYLCKKCSAVKGKPRERPGQ